MMSTMTWCVLLLMTMVLGCAPSDEASPHLPSSAAGGSLAVPTIAPTGNDAARPAISPTPAGAPPASLPGAAGSVAAPPPATGLAGAPGPATPPPPPLATPGVPVPTGCKAMAPCSNGTEPVIPPPVGECPKMVTGAFTFMGVTSRIWVGNKGSTPAPIMLYWHGTGGTAATATSELDPTLVQEIMGQGGVIGSIEGGIKGDTLDWGVFTTGDYQSADQIVACAVQQLNIDTKRIYSSGASAGGLAAGEIAYGRSSYVAATLPNSGGQGGYPYNLVLQDPSHVPAAMTMHGAHGVDVVVIDFGDSSLREDIDIAKKGGFAVDCDHGGSHVGAPAALKSAGWDFLKKHPFGFGTSPYASGLPATYPKYCTIVTKDTPMPVSTMMGTGMTPPRAP